MPVESAGEARMIRGEAPARRFGLRVGGVPLLLPETALEHVQGASVYPLPGAAPGVLGLAQLRGHPVVVLDPAPEEGRARSPAARHSLLVIGTPPEAGALAVDALPQPVLLGPSRRGAAAPAVRFAAALDAAFEDAGEPGTLWWGFEPRRLFELMAAG